MAMNLLEKIELDAVLSKFSVCGRYHAVTAVWIVLGLTFNTMTFCNYVLIAEEIKYRNVHNATNAQFTDPLPRTQWIYENPDSFVAEFQLAHQEWKRTLVGTVHSFGYMVGVIIIGPLSDKFGRRTLAIITGVTGAMCGLAKSFVTFYWIYVVFEFLEASLGDPYSPLYMLGLEMVSADSRVTYMTTCSIGLVIGGMLLPLAIWLVPYWRTCLRVMYTPGLLFIILIYLVDESPRWLLTKGKLNKAVENIKKSAKLNKIEIEENLNMLSYEKDVSAKFMTVIKDTFKSRPLMKSFFVCIIWWNTCTFVNNGLTISSVLLEGNKYINFALLFAVRLPSCIIAAFIMKKFNRRGPLFSCFLVCAVICACQPFIPKNIIWLTVAVYMTSKLISGMYFTIVYIYTCELFPTYTRNSMQALCSCVGRIGAIVATQMPLLKVYWSGLPIVMFGAMSLLAALVTLLVPDTAKTALPDTVRQAEALGALETRTLIKKGRTANRRSRNNSAIFEKTIFTNVD